MRGPSAVPDNVSSMLEVNLLSRVQAPNGISVLECNFDTALLTLYEEMRFWYRLGFALPSCSTEMLPKEERLRVFRENVAVVVRDYNHIVNLLSSVCTVPVPLFFKKENFVSRSNSLQELGT